MPVKETKSIKNINVMSVKETKVSKETKSIKDINVMSVRDQCESETQSVKDINVMSVRDQCESETQSVKDINAMLDPTIVAAILEGWTATNPSMY